MTSSPIVARWELSRRLGNRRKKLGLGVSAITEELGFTRNYWSAVENDRTLIAEDKLRLLFDVLDFQEPDRTELLELRAAGRKRGWWDEYSHVLDDDQKHFFGLEDGAARIRTYESNIIPGLLQIEEYTSAFLRSDPAFSQLALNDLLAIRQRRKRRLQSDPPVEFIALVSEAALRQQLDGPEVQRRQLDHVLRLATEGKDALQLHVVPFTINPGVIAGSSTLLFFEYESEHLPCVAWQEAVRVLDLVSDDDDEFRRLEHSWNDGLSNSLDRDESVAILRDVIDQLG